jgi:hypothetical protein
MSMFGQRSLQFFNRKVVIAIVSLSFHTMSWIFDLCLAVFLPTPEGIAICWVGVNGILEGQGTVAAQYEAHRFASDVIDNLYFRWMGLQVSINPIHRLQVVCAIVLCTDDCFQGGSTN